MYNCLANAYFFSAVDATYFFECPMPSFCVQYRASFVSANPSCPSVTEATVCRLVCSDEVVRKFRVDGVPVKIVVALFVVLVDDEAAILFVCFFC